MKIFLITTVTFLAFSIACKAQGTTAPQLIPPTPTAYAFAKYGDVPVSLSSGIPNIDIPLYTLVDHDIYIGVSLSYYAGGIKVDEEASNVGLGWSLNAGGTITRVVRGKPDDLINGVFQPRTDITMTPPVADSTLPDFMTQYGLESASHNGTDSGPDLFIFNFNGRTGKFCFDKSGNVVLLKKEDLDISWQQGASGLEFVIRDEKGVTYKFTKHETSYFQSISGEAISSWYLTSITSPANNVINIEYINYYGVHYSNNSAPIFLFVPNNHVTVMNATGTPSNPPYNATNQSEMHISKITSNNGSVEFIYKTQKREDMYSDDYALAEVGIYNQSHTAIKSFKLSTSYFVANNARVYPSSLTQYQHLNKRLRLDAVQEYDGQGLIVATPPYQITYLGDNDPTTDDPYTLPVRLSPQQDHWGFYNYSGNTVLFPGAANYLSAPASINGGLDNLSYLLTITGGATREPDTAAMKAGMIKRITYPTSGHTDFLFEPNYSIAYQEGGVRIKTIKNYPLIGQPTQKDYSYVGNSNDDPHKHYYETYMVTYHPFSNGSDNPPYFTTDPITSALDILGVPYDVNSRSHETWESWVKVSAQSQQVLSLGNNPGYDEVKVSETGNGCVITLFNNNDNPDYNGDDSYNEGTSAELSLLTGLFQGTGVAHVLTLGPPAIYKNEVVNTAITWRDWPYIPVFDNSWKRGVETTRKSYRENGTLAKSEDFKYSHKLLTVVPGYMVYAFTPSSQQMYFWATYGIPGGLTRLESQSETLYDVNGQNPVINTTNYFYDNPNHLQATRVEKLNSDGKKLVNLTSLPLDFAPGTSFIDNMVTAHLVSFPIEQVSYADDGNSKRITSGSLIYYLGGNSLIDHVQTLSLSGNLCF